MEKLLLCLDLWRAAQSGQRYRKGVGDGEIKAIQGAAHRHFNGYAETRMSGRSETVGRKAIQPNSRVPIVESRQFKPSRGVKTLKPEGVKRTETGQRAKSRRFKGVCGTFVKRRESNDKRITNEPIQRGFCSRRLSVSTVQFHCSRPYFCSKMFIPLVTKNAENKGFQGKSRVATRPRLTDFARHGIVTRLSRC